MSDPFSVLTSNLMARDTTIRNLREDLAEADRQLAAMAKQAGTDRAERDDARSEAAANGVIRDAWKDRALAAEAEVERLRRALEDKP